MQSTPHGCTEARRWQAWRLLQKGWPPRQIAKAQVDLGSGLHWDTAL
jgi:hypothetical protein